MQQTWRWFGPQDPITVADMLQAGVQGVVTALHHVPPGEVWSPAEIAKRQAEVAHLPDGSAAGLCWEVVESLPVSEAIKKRKGDYVAQLENYTASLRNLAAAGIEVICYNFMPVLDWTRTDLAWRVGHGGTTMRFDHVDFAAFDIHILQRTNAAHEYPAEVQAEAERRFRAWSDADRQRLLGNIVCGLPGAAEQMTIADVRQHLDEYQSITATELWSNFAHFLEQVVPVADELGLRLCCHPDDPPFPLMGLPRIMSTEADYAKFIGLVDLPSNGITLCSGSLGANPANDLPGMMERLGERVHFLHLRNVTRETPEQPCSFHEAEHLEGDTDMVALIAMIIKEENRRRKQGRKDCVIPMRADHGQDILDDLNRQGQPGYPAIGRLKALAELRGIMTTLEHPQLGQLG